MKTILLCPLILLGLILIFTSGCKKDSNSPQPGTLKDHDGNVYHPVTLGSQVWMAENLKTTSLNDGTPILNAVDNTAWVYANSPAYCWYNDSATYKTSYGALYNWNAASNSKLCPSGWHVPSDADWTALTTYMGGNYTSGGVLKEPGSAHWFAPNLLSDSSCSFAALPGGYRTNGGGFYSVKTLGFWWSSTQIVAEDSTTYYAWAREMSYNSTSTYVVADYKSAGYSVRCIKDK